MARTVNSHKKNLKMVQLALLAAIIVVLQLLATFLIRVGAVAPTLALIPLVIGGAALGIRAAAVLGGVFSFVAFICGLTGFDAFTNAMIMYKPFETFLVCFLKGILAGILSALVYKGCMKLFRKNVFISSLLSAVIAPVANTAVYIVGMAVFFRDMVTSADGTPVFSNNDAIMTVIIGVFLMIVSNFILEVIVTGVSCPILASILAKSKAFKKMLVK